ncbi:hypothetical protein BZG36_03571 [Bifiguratus adelaidae]|uniref:Sulfotransferase domain-containing protein n=1 Tax=Bifiguratus adelaidae TaxID=1938954 RepID=A0A261Y096_9FUNG|nr:hypothetical protein BZG36_03571 [Bifiguratus adelaidae]
MTIQVFCTGYCRTGTKSIKEALETLGYPCFHMTEIVSGCRDAKIWMDAADGKEVDWDAYFEGYEAVCDWPAVTFNKELIDHYPNAKIIHSVRDGESWYQSARNTIWDVSTMKCSFPMSLFTPKGFRQMQQLAAMLWKRDFDDRLTDKEHTIRMMEKHTQGVLDYKGKDNVLVFRVQDGWEPLCAFLGVPVPNGPFPHINDSKSFRAYIDKMKRTNVVVYRAFWSGLAAGFAVIAVQVAKRPQLLGL